MQRSYKFCHTQNQIILNLSLDFFNYYLIFLTSLNYLHCISPIFCTLTFYFYPHWCLSRLLFHSKFSACWLLNHLWQTQSHWCQAALKCDSIAFLPTIRSLSLKESGKCIVSLCWGDCNELVNCAVSELKELIIRSTK